MRHRPGRDERFRQIYAEHRPAICAYLARRTDREYVDDLAAETFTAAWRRLPAEIEDPLPWLYGVARNVLHNHRRRVSGRARMLDRLVARTSRAPGGEPHDVVLADPLLASAFARLSQREREAICLVAWEGLDLERAAAAAGCSNATFRARLSRGRAKLRAALEPAAATPSTQMTKESLA
jgi:RNA polymerase sigma factor (sigma-70 family)